jgi:hypothetical protein
LERRCDGSELAKCHVGVCSAEVGVSGDLD